MIKSVAIIGYGEVGSIFARDLHALGVGRIIVHDVAETAAYQAKRDPHVVWSDDAADAVRGTDLVFIAVTAAATLGALRSLEGGLRTGPLVVDITSISPSSRTAGGEIIAGYGGRYVESVIMTSVPPKGLRSPMLLGGPDAATFAAEVANWELDLTLFSDRIGPASSVKMCRSVMIKGLEALTMECLLSARRYGVEQEVLASLADTLPHPDWPGLARYMLTRTLQHGRRRAEEMREVAHTVEDVGVEPMLSQAIARRQDWSYAEGKRLPPGALRDADLATLLDLLSPSSGD